MREQPVVPGVMMGVIDVRDVAQAHVKAMTLDAAAGNSYTCTFR